MYLSLLTAPSLVPRPSVIISIGRKDSLVYAVCTCTIIPVIVRNRNRHALILFVNL